MRLDSLANLDYRPEQLLKQFLDSNPKWCAAIIVRHKLINDNFPTYYDYDEDTQWVVELDGKWYNFIINIPRGRNYGGRPQKAGVIYKRFYRDGESPIKRKRTYKRFEWIPSWKVVEYPGEHRKDADCQIWSFAVCTGLSYDAAYEALAAEGWSERSTNMMSIRWEKACTKLGFTFTRIWASWNRDTKGMTLKTVGQRFPTGTYAISIRGHACALKNGELYDSAFDSELKRVESVYQITRMV